MLIDVAPKTDILGCQMTSCKFKNLRDQDRDSLVRKRFERRFLSGSPAVLGRVSPPELSAELAEITLEDGSAYQRFVRVGQTYTKGAASSKVSALGLRNDETEYGC